MLTTPLGTIQLFVNDIEVPFTATKLEGDHRCPDVNGRYIIQYTFKSNMTKQEIRCCIPSLNIEGEIESGENLEAISFYKDQSKLTIGIEAEFSNEVNAFDYDGNYLSHGVQYVTTPTTPNRIFSFGICWIHPVTDDNDSQTWYGADPTLM